MRLLESKYGANISFVFLRGRSDNQQLRKLLPAKRKYCHTVLIKSSLEVSKTQKRLLLFLQSVGIRTNLTQSGSFFSYQLILYSDINTVLIAKRNFEEIPSSILMFPFCV